MCGIGALLDFSGALDAASALRSMMATVRHRGPDDEGYALIAGPGTRFLGGGDTPEDCFSHPARYAPRGRIGAEKPGPARVALGHRRLSIIDLSPAGHQPMCSEDGRLTVIFNGEIYNFVELRRELEAHGHRFATQSDTEVILHAYDRWGEGCLRRFNGMFAIVIHDAREDRVLAARDRFGVKPLYYWRSPAGFLAFASEIKQFTVLPGWRAGMNGQAAYDYLNWGLTDHTRETCFAQVLQLRGGELVHDRVADLARGFRTRVWYLLTPAPFAGTPPEAASTYRELFTDSVRLRMRADVPIGTGLSGGLDSSSIVCVVNALLREQGASGLQKTFSACSDEKAVDEREFIDVVVRATGVDAHRTMPSVDGIFPALPRITWHQDEPFISTSIYAEWCVFELVRSTGVKVTLDGHGADELLAGYHTFFGAHYAGLFRSLRLLGLVREALASRRIHGHGFSHSAQLALAVLLPEFLRQPLRRMAGLNATRPSWLDLGRLRAEDRDPYAGSGLKTASVNRFSAVLLTRTSLPFQLHWCDRDSMAHGVESRAPFLDYRFVEFVLGLPPACKIGAGVTKRILRQAMKGVLPVPILNRMSKIGFATPEEVWIRRTAPDRFRKAAAEALEKSRGLLTPSLMDKVDRYLAGKPIPATMIWRVINFTTWMDRFSVALPA